MAKLADAFYECKNEFGAPLQKCNGENCLNKHNEMGELRERI